MKDRIFLQKNKFYVFFLIFALGSLLLAGCSRSSGPVSRTAFYFDTVITVTLYQDADQKLFDGCFSLCDTYEKMLSRTVEGSDIYRINHSGGEPVEVSSETALLLTCALSYAEQSGGVIDPTVAPLMELWNFTGSGSDSSGSGSGSVSASDPSSGQKSRVPSESEISALLPAVNYRSVHVEGNTVTLDNPDTRIDLGFIAKGYIADRLKEYLTEQGVSHALINLGGNILTLGDKPDGTPYRIGVRRPFDAEDEAIVTLSVSDRSLVSSGVYERYFEENGKLYHHILNAHTGYPVENNLLGVTILSSSSMEGDALSTTCFCLGLEEGMALIESLPGVEAVFITDDYQLHTSSGLTISG